MSKEHTTVVPGEKRRVAVLSMDVGGVERLTAFPFGDSSNRILALITEELCACITTFGGQYTTPHSNVIVGTFGASNTNEHSCRRAIDCCFRMFKSLGMIGKSVNSENAKNNINLTASAGIAWGLASVTPDSEKKLFIHGRCMDLANQLRKLAPADTILVSEKVMKASSDFFTWEEFEGFKQTWIPLRKRDSQLIHPLLHNSSLIGRERETARLEAAFNSYLKWFNHPAVFVSGKPGSGKTSFVENFLSGIKQDDARIIRLSNKLWDQPPLGTWLPLMEKGTFDPYGTIMAKIRELRLDGNLILVIEDLHWADAASLNLLDQLSRTLTDAGVFLIVSSRNTPTDYLLQSSEKFVIEGLNKESVNKMLKSLLGSAEGVEDYRFVDFLIESTGGNPLLLTELIVHAFETGIIARNRNGDWFLDKKLEHVVSDTAESFLIARISNLNPTERFALQVASVLGSGFDENLFCDLFSSLGMKLPRLLLSRLINMGFLTTKENDSYHFLNSLMAESVYNTILKGNRILIHQKAAEILSENLNPLEDKTLSITISRHWIESESGEEAVPFLLNALEYCLEAADANRAETLAGEIQRRIPKNSCYSSRADYYDMQLYLMMGKFQLALDAAETLKSSFSGRELALIYSTMAQAKENMGRPLNEVRKDYLIAAKTAESTGDKNVAANNYSSAGAVCVSLGRIEEALSVLNKALEYENSLEKIPLAKLHGNMGILMQRTGSLKEALNHYSKTYQLARECVNSTIEANALAYMGQIEINMGRKDEGFSKYREALAIHRKSGNKRGECIILGNLGGSLARFGEAENAISALERAIRLGEEIGHTRGVMTFHSNIGLAYKLDGQYDKAEQHIREAMEMIKETGDKRALAVSNLNLSGVLSKKWRIQEAIGAARRSLRFACTVNALTTQARALGSLGSLMLKTDRVQMAYNFYKEAAKRCSAAEDHSSLVGHAIGESTCLFELGQHANAMKKYSEVKKLKEAFGMDIEGENDLKELEKLLGILHE